MRHLTEQFFAETGDEAMYRMKSSDYHTLRYVKWLEAKVEKFTATNTARDEILLCYPNTPCEWNDKGECRSSGACSMQRKTSPVA